MHCYELQLTKSMLTKSMLASALLKKAAAFYNLYKSHVFAYRCARQQLADTQHTLSHFLFCSSPPSLSPKGKSLGVHWQTWSINASWRLTLFHRPPGDLHIKIFHVVFKVHGDIWNMYTDFSSLFEVKGCQGITASGAMHKMTLLAASSGSSGLTSSNSLHLVEAIYAFT